MTTATQTPPATELADRFRCEADVPDPPRDAAGRKQYWEDTVAEAVAELRRRLASTRDEKSFQALQMIVDLEKTRLRHNAPVAGTQATQTGGGRWADGLEPLPVYTQCDREFALKKAEPKAEDLTPPAAPATLSVPEKVEAEVVGEDGRQQNDDGVLNTPSPERGGGRGVGSSADLAAYPFPPKPLRPIPMRERVKLQHLQSGVICHFHDHDDDWMLEPGRGRRARAVLAARAAAAVAASVPTPPPAAGAPDPDTAARLLW